MRNGRCSIETVGAIHESPAVGIIDKLGTKPPFKGGLSAKRVGGAHIAPWHRLVRLHLHHMA